MTVEVVLLIITEIVKVVTAATVLVTTESITAATGTISGVTTERITIDKITTVTTETDRRTTTETTIGQSEATCSCNLCKSFTPRHIGVKKNEIFSFSRYGNYGHGHMERKRKPEDYYDRRFAKESRPQDPRSRPGMSSISPMMDPHEYHWPRFSPPGGHWQTFAKCWSSV